MHMQHGECLLSFVSFCILNTSYRICTALCNVLQVWMFAITQCFVILHDLNISKPSKQSLTHVPFSQTLEKQFSNYKSKQ